MPHRNKNSRSSDGDEDYTPPGKKSKRENSLPQSFYAVRIEVDGKPKQAELELNPLGTDRKEVPLPNRNGTSSNGDKDYTLPGKRSKRDDLQPTSLHASRIKSSGELEQAEEKIKQIKTQLSGYQTAYSRLEVMYRARKESHGRLTTELKEMEKKLSEAHKALETEKANDDCPLCLSAKRDIATTCGHRFCEDCYVRHVAAVFYGPGDYVTQPPKCPLCNTAGGGFGPAYIKLY